MHPTDYAPSSRVVAIGGSIAVAKGVERWRLSTQAAGAESRVNEPDEGADDEEDEGGEDEPAPRRMSAVVVVVAGIGVIVGVRRSIVLSGHAWLG